MLRKVDEGSHRKPNLCIEAFSVSSTLWGKDMKRLSLTVVAVASIIFP